jgi:hypothetical protein
MQHDTELGFTIHSCRYFLGEVEDKDLLKDADLTFRGRPVAERPKWFP